MQEAGAVMLPPRPDDGAMSVLEQRLDPCDEQGCHADEFHEDEQGRSCHVLERIAYGVSSNGRLMFEDPLRPLSSMSFFALSKAGPVLLKNGPSKAELSTAPMRSTPSAQ